MAQLFPSLISADLMNLRAALQALDPHCDGYHLDVMDNHFVPNLTWGPQFINAIANTTAKPLLVHLMVDDPTDWLKKFTLPDHSTIIIHIESKGQIRKNLARIKEQHINAGLALNPQSSVQTLFPFLDIVDSVLIMSVEPGFSGQAFIPEVIDKLDPLRSYRETKGLKFIIGMDGGIDAHNIGQLANKGVERFSIASALFDQPNHLKALQQLYAALK